MSELSRNRLSCTRCKAKKIKCGREEPKCQRCSAIQASCFYPKRKQKVRGAKKQPDVLSQILRRLSHIEKRIGLSSEDEHIATGETVHQRSDTSPSGDHDSITSNDSDGEDAEDEEEIYTGTDHETRLKPLYQLMDEAANTTKNVFQSAPEVYTSNQDADSLFSSALASIRNFRWKDESSDDGASKLDLPLHTAQKWIELCFQSKFFEGWIGSTNKSLMLAMPNIIESPAINVHHSVLVLYYCVLFCGWRCDVDSSLPQWKDYGSKFYRECLRLFPGWRNNGLPATVMDFTALGIMTLIAVENFDYHLGWDLHLACCEVARELKLDSLDDADPSKRPGGYKDEASKNVIRKKIWQLIHLEFFFRLYYDKPATLTGMEFSVNFPSVTATSEAISRSDTVYFLVSSRNVFITKEFFEVLQEPGDDLQHRVQSLMDQIENVMIEWNLEELLASPDGGKQNAWVYADLLINGYINIILMERKAFGIRGKSGPPSKRSVHAARKTLETILALSQTFDHQASNTIGFISFYPFVAFFTLYHHILFTLQQPHEQEPKSLNRTENDIRLMESLGHLLAKLAPIQAEFGPVANAVTALAKASQHLISTSVMNTPNSTLQTPPPTFHNLRKRPPSTQSKDSVVVDVDGTIGHAPHSPAFDWANMDEPSLSQLEAGVQQYGLQTPWLYVESMESDLFGRNWHQRRCDQ